VVKLFDDVPFLGQVAGWVAGGADGDEQWLVVYSDGDTDEMETQELSDTVMAVLRSTHEPKSMAKMQKMLVLRVEEWLRKHDAEFRRALARDKRGRHNPSTGVAAAGSKRRRDTHELEEVVVAVEEAEEEEDDEDDEEYEEEDDNDDGEEAEVEEKAIEMEGVDEMDADDTVSLKEKAKENMSEEEPKKVLSRGVADAGHRVRSIFDVLGKAPAGAQGGSSPASATASAAATATTVTAMNEPPSTSSRNGGDLVEGKKGGGVIKRIEEENAEKVAKLNVLKNSLGNQLDEKCRSALMNMKVIHPV
jgi:hypothetical protein